MRILRSYGLIALIALAVILSAESTQAATLKTEGSVEVDCQNILKSKDKGRLMVALMFGQSNAANFGLVPKKSMPGVYSFYNGKCFKASDPLPGATGTGGSIWTRLGDKLITTDMYDTVLFVPVGMGASKVADWKPGGSVHHRLATGLRGAMATGFVFTHLIWMQGERDAIVKTTREAYMEDFVEMLTALRGGGVDAKVFVSQTSLCGIYESDAVRRAQRQIAKEHAGVFAGPDTDALGKKYRYDTCHFNEMGLEAAADAWLSAIQATE